MMSYSSKDDLQLLIDNRIAESTTLEYKSSFAKQNPKWREELAKDVSAMANANGGHIIYGIREKAESDGHAVADKLMPICHNEMSKDQLSQLLSTNIQPIIEGIEITYIPNDEETGFYVVQIPKGMTAHQNLLTHIYYIRRNSTVEAMEDFAIRDIMNRRKNPIIDLDFTLIERIVNVTTRNYTPWMQRSDEKSQRKEYFLKYRFFNSGEIYAKYINGFIYIPKMVISENDDYDEMGDYYIIYDDNTKRDLMSVKGMQKEYGPVRYDPLLPGTSCKGGNIEICLDDLQLEELPPIYYEIHADNAPVRKIFVPWKEIEIKQEVKSEFVDPMAPPSFI